MGPDVFLLSRTTNNDVAHRDHTIHAQDLILTESSGDQDAGGRIDRTRSSREYGRGSDWVLLMRGPVRMERQWLVPRMIRDLMLLSFHHLSVPELSKLRAAQLLGDPCASMKFMPGCMAPRYLVRDTAP